MFVYAPGRASGFATAFQTVAAEGLAPEAAEQMTDYLIELAIDTVVRVAACGGLSCPAEPPLFAVLPGSDIYMVGWTNDEGDFLIASEAALPWLDHCLVLHAALPENEPALESDPA